MTLTPSDSWRSFICEPGNKHANRPPRQAPGEDSSLQPQVLTFPTGFNFLVVVKSIMLGQSPRPATRRVVSVRGWPSRFRLLRQHSAKTGSGVPDVSGVCCWWILPVDSGRLVHRGLSRTTTNLAGCCHHSEKTLFNFSFPCRLLCTMPFY